MSIADNAIKATIAIALCMSMSSVDFILLGFDCQENFLAGGGAAEKEEEKKDEPEEESDEVFLAYLHQLIWHMLLRTMCF